MIRVLHAEHTLSDRFISYMLERNIRIEEDLIDQLFNSSEKRLARTLLLLARYGKGFYVYDAFALYRQLPSGVPGAYRLLGNLVSLRKNPAWK